MTGRNRPTACKGLERGAAGAAPPPPQRAVAALAAPCRNSFLALAVVVYRLKDGIWPGGRVQGVRWSTGRCKWAGGSEGDGGAGIGSVELMRQKTDGQCGRKQMASDQGSSLFVSLVSCSGRLVGKCAALRVLQRGGSVRLGEWAGQMLVVRTWPGSYAPPFARYGVGSCKVQPALTGRRSRVRQKFAAAAGGCVLLEG